MLANGKSHIKLTLGAMSRCNLVDLSKSGLGCNFFYTPCLYAPGARQLHEWWRGLNRMLNTYSL